MLRKITWDEMVKKMTEYAKRGIDAKACVVFTEDSFDEPCTLKGRTYEVFSNAKYFNPDMIGTSLPGYALDGSDNGPDLLDTDWKVEGCYMDPYNPPLD